MAPHNGRGNATLKAGQKWLAVRGRGAPLILCKSDHQAQQTHTGRKVKLATKNISEKYKKL